MAGNPMRGGTRGRNGGTTVGAAKRGAAAVVAGAIATAPAEAMAGGRNTESTVNIGMVAVSTGREKLEGVKGRTRAARLRATFFKTPSPGKKSSRGHYRVFA